MENYSGSIVESKLNSPTQTTPSRNKFKIFAIVFMIAEAIIIAGLAIFLAITAAKTNMDNSDKDVGYLDEEPLYILDDDDADTLMYIYLLANDSMFNSQNIPKNTCSILEKIYNSAKEETSPEATDLCPDNQISLFSLSSVDEDLIARGVRHVGIVSDNQVYNFYVFSDFSMIEYVEKSNDASSMELRVFNVV